MAYEDTSFTSAHEWELVQHIELMYANSTYGGGQSGFQFNNLDPTVDEYMIRYDIAVPGGQPSQYFYFYIGFNNDWSANYRDSIHTSGRAASANVHIQETDLGSGAFLLGNARVAHTAYRCRGEVRFYPQRFNNQDVSIIDHTGRMTVQGICHSNYSIDEFLTHRADGLYNLTLASQTLYTCYLFVGNSCTLYGTAELYRHKRDWR